MSLRMMGRKRKKTGKLCYLCGNEATTRDHIPPRGLFPDPKPSNLITVPACKECNEASSLDDEYFRWFVATASFENPEAERLIDERILKRFDRKPSLLNKILSRAIDVDIFSQGGIYLGKQPAFEYDGERIQKILDKIVRGLYYKHTNNIYGNQNMIIPFVYNPTIPKKIQNQICSLPLHNIGNGNIFSYRYFISSKKQGRSFWFLMFFNITPFVIASEPISAI